MSARKRLFSRGADIVHSPDDGGWWVQLWQQDPEGNITEIAVPDSPIFSTAAKAEAWARKHGAGALLRV